MRRDVGIQRCEEYRAACYLCDWFSDYEWGQDFARKALAEHKRTPEHREVLARGKEEA